MSEKYSVSARRFRPRTFSEIVGQPHIVRTLTNALSKGRIAHAYLFTGTRGVGKTTTARILAKALNCENGPTAEPCLTCGNCVEIANGNAMDVIEIDGASNRGIDNIRELRENALFAPVKSRYKIYIIDEVHQISRDAFNALLKTLEEPPPHVVFIFATTELSKVPETILSRVQAFEYKPISLGDIAAQLAMVAEKQGVTASEGAIRLLARRGRGSMRDAQSLFDQAAAYGGGSVTEEDVKLILGMADGKGVEEVIDSVADADRARVFAAAGRLAYAGGDPALFMEELAEAIRNTVAAKLDPATLADVEADERDRLARWAERFDHDELQRFFDVIVATLERMRRSPLPAMDMEMGLLRLVTARETTSVDALLRQVEQARAAVERRAADPLDPPAGGTGTGPFAEAPPARSAPPPPVAETVAEPVADDDEEPEFEIVEEVAKSAPADLLKEFGSVKPSVAGILGHSQAKLTDDAVVIVVKSGFEVEQLNDPEVRPDLERIASQFLGRKTRLVVELHAPERKKQAMDDAARQRHAEQERSVKEQIMDVPIIQDALDLFDGEILDVSVGKKP